MSTAEFNVLNSKAGAHLSPRGSDWIGVNSPVDVVIRLNGEEVVIADRQRGGGLQVASSANYADSNWQSSPSLVTTVTANVGEGMQRLNEVLTPVQDKCDALARMAGVPPEAIPEASVVASILANKPAGTFAEETLCEGSGDEIGFQIRASHYRENGEHGGDHNYAYIQVSLHASKNGSLE